MLNFVIFARLENEGYIVTTSAEAGKSGLKAKNVVFCAPPTGNNQYAEDVARAVKEVRLECTKDFFEEGFEVMSVALMHTWLLISSQIWIGSAGGGAAVFTSSGGVYKVASLRLPPKFIMMFVKENSDSDSYDHQCQTELTDPTFAEKPPFRS